MSDNLKIVVVGDSFVGKTTLVTAYGQDTYVKQWIPTIADKHLGKIEYDGQGIPVIIWDTAGQPDLVRIRALHYNECDAFVICFDLSDIESLNNAKTFWINELRKLGPSNVPIILCGTKADLRDN